MIKIVESDFSREEWNEVVEHPLQAWEWGEAREKLGVEVLRVGEFEEDKLTNAFQLTLHRLPKTNYKVGYLPRSVWPNDEILKFLSTWGKENGLVFIKIEPYGISSTSRRPSENSHFLRDGRLVRSSHQLFPDWTIFLDIEKTDEILLKGMKPKTRYNIRLAEKKGVTVKEMTNKAGFETFWKLYHQTTKRQGYFGHNKHYHETIFETLKGELAYILIAEYENSPLAAYELFIFKDRAYYPYGGSSLEHKNLMAPNLLMWEAIKFAKSKGAKYFDMWGAASPMTKNDPYAGFTRFKEGYGGSYGELVGSFDLVIKPFSYKLYSFTHKLRNMWLNLRAD